MTIGVSGHQSLAADRTTWIKDNFRKALIDHHASKGVSCLAAGTDQLFALTLLELGLELDVVTPCDNYQSVFSDVTSKSLYSDLYDRASGHYRLPFTSPSEEAFLRAGERVVDLSDLMLFVWNGKPAAGLGGTADIVKYAASKNVPFLHFNPVTLNVAVSDIS
jgi:hypothetical protein